MTTSRHIQTPRRPWTPAEELVLRDLYPDVPCADIAALLGRLPGSIYDHAQRAGLEKSAYFWASDATGRIQRGKTLPAMIATRFKPGATPWNKGVRYQAGGRSAQTRFKAGGVPGNWVPVGSYRINSYGMYQAMYGCAGIKEWDGKYGFTGPGLLAVTDAINLYEDILRLSTPRQMLYAQDAAYRRMVGMVGLVV